MKKVGFVQPVPLQSGSVGEPGSSAEPVDPGVMEPVYVTFKYPKEVMPYQPAVTAGLISIVIDDGGSGYTAPATVALPAGVTNAELKAVIENGSLTRIEVIKEGTGWAQGQALTISPAPTGTGARAAEAHVNAREGKAAQSAIYETMAFQVPILTMLPVPYLRIEEVNLEFAVQIDQTESLDIDASVGADAGGGEGAGAGAGVFSGSAQFSTSIATQVTGGYSNTINRKYSMDVKVRAVQAEMPAGLERLLGILQSSMISQPVSAFMSP